MTKVKKFQYKDTKGKETDREVYMIASPSDKYFGLDLTEFSEQEREYYIDELANLDEFIKDTVSQLGLKHNYRYFKKDKMEFKDG